MLKTGGGRGLFLFLILISNLEDIQEDMAPMKQEQANRNKENTGQEKALGN